MYNYWQSNSFDFQVFLINYFHFDTVLFDRNEKLLFVIFKILIAQCFCNGKQNIPVHFLIVSRKNVQTEAVNNLYIIVKNIKL